MAYYYATPAGAGTKNGADWANAFGTTELVAHLLASTVAGDVYFVAGGTYTLVASLISPRDGNESLTVSVVGVNAGTTAEPPTTNDLAAGNDRPLFACGAYRLELDNYWQHYCIGGTGTNTMVFGFGDYCRCYNCYAYNSSAVAARAGFNGQGTGSEFLFCEAISTNGYAIMTSVGGKIYKSWCHDSDIGGYTTRGDKVVQDSIFSSCNTGLFAHYAGTIKNNTIDGNAIGVKGRDLGMLLLNNSITNNGTGVLFDNAGAIVVPFTDDYNNYFGNTQDMSWDNGATENNAAKGPNSIAVDPEYTNAAGGDFSLSGSNLNNLDKRLDLGVG